MVNAIGPDMVRRLKTVAEPSISPDGTLVAYTLAQVDPDTWESSSKVMLLNLASGEAKEITEGNKDSAPRFAPDGKTIGFLRADAKERKQLWKVGAEGGEPAPVTEGTDGVVDFAWSPDASKVVFCADVKAEVDQAADGNDELPRVREAHRIRYQYDTLGWRGESHFHLFVVDLETGEQVQLTDGDWDDAAPVWSPDGSQLAFISGRRDDRDRLAQTEAYVVGVDGGEPELWSEGLSSVGAVAWAPDGERLVVIGSEAAGFLVSWQGWLYVLEPGNQPKRLTDDSFRPTVTFPSTSRAPEMRWTDSEGILLVGDVGGESFVYRVGPDGGEAKAIAGGGQLTTDLSLVATGGLGVVLSSMPESPVDLHSVNIGTGDGKQLTFHNRDYLENHPAAGMEKFVVGREGWEIDCRLFFPAEFESSRKYPLVLDIHGGPNGAFYDSFVPWQQVLASAGYLVLAANPRGSSTYGEDFMMAVLGDWGGEDYLDLMAAVEEVAGRDYVDETRMGIHGYSYGGYMTSWTVGHTNRFRAAVVGAPCINLHSMYGTSDIAISFGEMQWGSSIANAAEEGYDKLALQLLERSPISYVHRVETPVLLLHGESDHRCPISQSEEYFTMLKRLGKEVEMVRFPGCSHLFPRMGHPKMREEYLERTLGWFNRHLG